jgi:hypothetical protein
MTPTEFAREVVKGLTDLFQAIHDRFTSIERRVAALEELMIRYHGTPVNSTDNPQSPDSTQEPKK